MVSAVSHLISIVSMAYGHLYSCGLGNSKFHNKCEGLDGVEGWMLGGSGSAWRKATKHSALGHATKSLLESKPFQ